MFSLKDFSYEFPQELIARYPLPDRDQSRLLVLNRAQQNLSHQNFADIAARFQKGDVLVFNDSKVFPSRLVTVRKSGGRQEILLVRKREDHLWEVLINADKKVKAGDCFAFENLKITIIDDPKADATEMRHARLEYSGNLLEILQAQAQMPLPPYLNRAAEKSDATRYQTIYAKQTGSVAAPTAGLHFTDTIFAQLQAKGVIFANVTLHVGPGTFLPVRTDDIREHKMHREFFSISSETQDIIAKAKEDKRPITAVGTTSVRVLETLAKTECADSTDIFLYPPYDFKIVDRLITNFHQPESTLLMLVCAFAGREFVLKAYQEAIKEKYRLFSYGDSMFIF